MKAIRCIKYGASENLVMDDFKKPSPKANEVLIKIKATAVTASDVHIRKLNEPPLAKFILQIIFGFDKPRNPILGMVSSGVIVDKGVKVNSFNIGDEVCAYGSMSSTKQRFGSYAEFICLPEEWNIVIKPKDLSYEEAAAIPYGGLLASHLMNQTSIKNGDKVLIYGASGSIGTMAIQLAKNAGAIVTSVCSRKNLALVNSLGSDKVIDYTDVYAERELETYKYVIDAVGKSKTSSLKEKSKTAIIDNGKYISIDAGIPKTPKNTFLKLMELVKIGKLKPVIDKVFPLDEIVLAHNYVEQGHKRGNVILRVSH